MDWLFRLSIPAAGKWNNSHILAAEPRQSTDEHGQLNSPSVTRPGEVMLYWTAPGDDGNIGRAAGYEIRFLPYPFGPINSEALWQGALRVGNEPQPSPAGRTDSMLVMGLEYPRSYFFCLKAYDDAGNYSGLSNSPLLATRPSALAPGDANGDGVCSGADVLYLLAYYRGQGPPPDPFYAGDANGDCLLNLADVTYIVNYLKGLGPMPILGSCGPLAAKASAIPAGKGDLR